MITLTYFDGSRRETFQGSYDSVVELLWHSSRLESPTRCAFMAHTRALVEGLHPQIQISCESTRSFIHSLTQLETYQLSRTEEQLPLFSILEKNESQKD